MLKAVEVVKAVKRIREDLAGVTTFYSINDLYVYYGDNAGENHCDRCRLNEGLHWFQGYNLRSEFPYHEILSEDVIAALVHPHCRCYLVRIPKESSTYEEAMRDLSGEPEE